jgi:hypothetical protein
LVGGGGALGLDGEESSCEASSYTTEERTAQKTAVSDPTYRPTLRRVSGRMIRRWREDFEAGTGRATFLTVTANER